jgi:hypothetical protein
LNSYPGRQIANRERFAVVHEEYRPGYNWEDLVEKEFKKSIPWSDFDDGSENTDATFDREDPEH